MDSPTGTGDCGPGYAALHEGLAVWTEADRVQLRVEGTRAVRMLDGLLSADVASMPAGSRLLSFILNAKGRPLAVPRVLRLDDALVLDISRAALPGLRDHFATYLPPRFAAVTELEEAARLSVLGPRWPDAAARLGLQAGAGGVLQELDAQVAGERFPVGVLRESVAGGGIDVYAWAEGTRESLTALVRDLGGDEATRAEYEVWRIEQGLPRFGVDVTGDNLPQETGLVERAVSFEKGCYTGQEVVARIHYRGHVNRRLLGLRPDRALPAEPLPPGAELYLDGRAAARVTSSCVSPRFGAIALAYVRREYEPGARLAAKPDAPVAWLVSDLPFTMP